jgi:ABC-type uncharacterized transport system permease subunit
MDVSIAPDFKSLATTFPHLYVWTGIWQEIGWDSIIYMAALGSVSQELHEAAMIDGASKWKRIRHVDLPSILPTAGIMMIIYQIACVVDWTVGQVEMARGSYAGVAVGALLGAALLLNVVKNKPLVMTIGLVGLQFTALPTIMKMVKAIMVEFNVTGLILALLSLLPAVFAVLFLFRGEKMTPEERMQYVF